ncbi:hypothetical protein B0H14DRAFT_3570344 [Mycena olivaceomarginata]|nr:hypothetical protein B0H14DRAFT_3570344 [Mycena olivaceomarginata]
MFQSLRWKFHTAPAPSPDPPPTDNAAQTATASKVRGRPRGSKNKPKPPLTAASTSSAATTRPPKKKPRTGDPPGMPQAPEQPNPRSISSLAHGLFRPRSRPSSPTSEPSAAASTSAQAGAAPSHQHDSTVLSLRPPPTHTSSVSPSSLPTPQHPPTTLPPASTASTSALYSTSRAALCAASNPAPPRARSTIQRARDLGIDTSPSTPPSSTSSPPNPLGLITDSNVDREYDPVSFIHSEGLGEEDEDPDAETAKCEFPAWFTARVDEIRAELTTDMASASARSRYYANGSFWIPHRATSFLLNKTNVKPTDIFACNFFLWDPLNILGTNFNLRCPTLNASIISPALASCSDHGVSWISTAASG